MKHTEKVQLSTIMTIDYNDFYDLITELCGDGYNIEDNYGEIRFFKTDDDGNEIENADEDSVSEYVMDKLSEYFEVTICCYDIKDRYSSKDVIIEYID